MKTRIINIITAIFIGFSLVSVYQNVYAVTPLKVKSFTVSCGNKVEKGKTIKLSATSSGGKGTKKYKFGYTLNNKTYTINNYSTKKSVNYKISSSGTYKFYVQIKDSKTTVKKTKNVSAYNPLSLSLTTSGSYVNENIKLTTTSSGGYSTKQYKYTYTLSSKTYTIKNYSSSKSVTFKPKKEGSYKFIAYVKDATGKVKSTYKTINVQYRPLSISLTTSGKYADENMTLTGSGSGGKGTLKYKFTYTLNGTTKTIKDYSTTKSVTFKPTIGSYTLTLTIKDEAGKTKSISKTVSVVFRDMVPSLTTSGLYVNENIVLTGDSSGGKGTKQYKYSYTFDNITKTIKDYSTSKAVNFEPTKEGTYQFTLDVKDEEGKVKSISKKVDVKCRDLSVSFTFNDSSSKNMMYLVAQGRGGQGPYKYEVSYKINETNQIVQEYMKITKVSFELLEEGTYEFIVNIKDARGVVATSTKTCIITDSNIQVSYSSKKISLKEYNLREKLVNVARSYIGVLEGSKQHTDIIALYNSEKNNMYSNSKYAHYTAKNSDSWCDIFTSACFIKAGYQSISGVECGCERHITLAKEKLKIWHEDDDYVPLIGDIIFYDWQDTGKGDCTGHSDHVGIVEKVENGIIYVIEGNKGNSETGIDEVGVREVMINGQFIRGFATPNYSSLIK